MRVLVAGLIGGIVMFIWGVAAHMMLGLGQVGFKLPADENVVLSSLHQGLGEHAGVYVLPALDPKTRKDPAQVIAYAQKAIRSPYAWVVYQPQGTDMTRMGPQIGRQWASDTLGALGLAFMMGLAGPGFRRRIAVAAVAVSFG